MDKAIEARFREHQDFDVITSTSPAWVSSSVPSSWPQPAAT
ncbi:hypothetical protein [Streptomyces chartreusis]|nr:hypothetical protein OG938_46585 [Streptomyces chartreusis]WTA33536.1 hypothetical protein OIA45_47045 [Streptomyces chartreusis]